MENKLTGKVKEISEQYLEKEVEKLLSAGRTEMERLYPSYLKACQADLFNNEICIDMGVKNEH